jgi:hypothetical protein
MAALLTRTSSRLRESRRQRTAETVGCSGDQDRAVHLRTQPEAHTVG